MVVLLRGNDVKIEWRFGFSGDNNSYTDGRFYVYCDSEDIDVPFIVEDNVLYATVSGNELKSGVYSMVFVYTDKNEISRRKVSKAFEITDDEESVVEGIVVADTSAYGRTLYSLTDVLAGRDNRSVEGAEEGHVLAFKNGLWRGVKIEVEDTGEGASELKEYIDKLFQLKKDSNGKDYISTPYSFASERTVSSLGISTGSGEPSVGGASALYQLIDVLRDGESVAGAFEGNSLVYKDGKWQGVMVKADLSEVEGAIGGIELTLGEHDKAINANKNSVDTLSGQVSEIKKAYDIIKTWFEVSEDGQTLITNYNLASNKTVSSLGVGSDNGGSGVSYDRLDNWDNYVEGDGSVLSSDLGYGLLVRIIDLEEGTSGDYASIEEKVDKNTNAITNLSTSLNDFLTGVDVDDTINRWKELEKFLEGYTETATLADLLKGKVDTNAYNTAIDGINETLGIHGTAINSNAANITSINTTLLNHNTRITDNANAINEIEKTLADWFTLENGVLHSKYGLASDKTVSSLGVGSSEGGGVSYDRLDSWDTYSADKAGYVLSAVLGYDLKTRLDNLDLGDFDLSGYLTKSEAQNTYATIIALNGKQNAITANNKLSASLVSGLSTVATSGKYSDLSGLPTLGILASKNNLVASDIPSLSWNKITSDKPTTLSGYGITDALPLSGGMISGTGADVLIVNRTDGNNSVITFDNNGTFLGRLGYSTKNTPIVQIDGEYKDIIHSGNIGSQSVNYATSAGNASKLVGYSADSLIAGYMKHHVAITVPSAGWYKIASYTETGYMPRQEASFQLFGTGGSTTPFTLNIRCAMGWSFSDSNIVIDGYNPYKIKIRFSKDSSHNYIEAYFNSAITDGLFLRVLYSNHSTGIDNNSWTWADTGALTQVTPTLTSSEVGGESGISSQRGFNGNASSASKLYTPRTIWGRKFDGSGNVDGHLHADGNIYIGQESASYTTQRYLYFWKGDGTYAHRGLMGVSEVGAFWDYWNKTTGVFRELVLGPDGLTYVNSVSSKMDFIINSSGNVLIGTTTDNGYKLDVNGNGRYYHNTRYALEISSSASSALIAFGGTDGSEKGQIGIGSDRTYMFNYESYRNNQNAVSGLAILNSGYFIVTRQGTVQLSESLFTINPSGNVTIGLGDLATTTYKLYVNGNANITGGICTPSDAYNSRGIATTWDDCWNDSDGVARPWYGLTFTNWVNENNVVLSGYYGITFNTGGGPFIFKGGRDVRPLSNKGCNLGNESYRWGTLFCSVGNFDDSVTIGDAKIWWDATNQVLRTDKSFASDKTVSSLGVGTESGGGGTGGYASLDNVASDVLPSASNTFTIGNSSRLWKVVYANNLYLGTTNVGESISSLQSGLSTANGNIGTLNTRVINIEGGYLPLSGGTLSKPLTISSGNDTKFILNNTDTDSKYQFISFRQNNTEYGQLGTSGGDDLVWGKAGLWKTIIHSGNIGSQSVASANKIMLNYIYKQNIEYPMLFTSRDNIGVAQNGLVYLDFCGNPTYNPSTNTLTVANLSGNASSATKLSTARTIWGQSFDGSENVNGSIRNCDFVRSTDTSIDGYYIGLASQGAEPYEGLLLFTYGNTPITMYTRGSERLRILSNGNVLIGTTEDNGRKLQVNGDIRVSDYITFGDHPHGENYGYGRIGSFDKPYSVSVQIGGYGKTFDSENHCFRVLNSVWNKDLFHVTDEGNVGIGVTSPNYKLHVEGDSYVNGSLTVSSSAKVNSLNVNDKASITNTGAINGTSLVMAGGHIQLYKNDDSAADYFTIDNAGNTYIGGTLGVDGAATFGSTLKVTGATTLEDKLTISKNGMSVSGTAYFGGGTTYYFGSTGNVSANTLTAAGATSLKSTLAVTGATTLSSTLGVSGNATFNSKVYIGGSSAYIYWDATNKVLRTNVSFASDKTVSSLGVGSESGGGGSADWGAVPTDILPISDDYYNIGSPSLRFSEGHFNNVYADAVEVGSCTIYSNGNASFGSLSVGGSAINFGNFATTSQLNSYVTLKSQQTIEGAKTFQNGLNFYGELKGYDAESGGDNIVLNASDGSVNLSTLTAGTAIYTGEKTAAWDGKSGAAIMASGSMVLCAAAPRIYFAYGNAASSAGVASLEAMSGSGLNFKYNMQVFTESESYANFIGLNFKNTRIFRLNNSSSGMQFQYGTSTSNVSTKGTFSTSGAYSASSDITKKNILSYNAGFNVHNIAEAPIAYFTWKDLTDNRVNLGSIAQYWQLIAPECIYGTEGIDMTMDYSTLGLVSSIINARAIVSHENEIDKLKKRVEELESENKRLQERVDALVA